MLSALRAQWNVVVLVATTVEVPVLSRVVGRLGGEPLLEEGRVGGVPTRIARPRKGEPWPALVFLNGSTRNGCADPAASGVVRGLARGGYLTFAPELPGLKEGELSISTLDAALAVVREAARHPQARDERVGLLGVSVGASLALLAAAESDLGQHVSVVAGLAPYADLERIARFATTGCYEEESGLRTARRVRLVLARSLAAQLPPGADRDALLAQLGGIGDGSDPFEIPSEGLGAEARALAALLGNRDPARYDALRADLPERVRAALQRLSPLETVHRLRVPAELASAPIDGYFPVGESRALAAAGPTVRLTLTSTIEHVHLRPSLRAVLDLLRFDRFAVRAFRAAAGSPAR